MMRNTFALLALLLMSCEGTFDNVSENPGGNTDPADSDTDNDTDTTVGGIRVSAYLNQASWNEDMTEVVDSYVEIEGASYDIQKTDFTGTTPDYVELNEGQEYTALYDFESNSASYLGQATKTFALNDTDPLLSANLCVDISGTWDFWDLDENGEKDDYYGYTEFTVEDNCTVDSPGVDEHVTIDGYAWRGRDLLGIVSGDGMSIEFHYRSGGRFIGERQQ